MSDAGWNPAPSTLVFSFKEQKKGRFIMATTDKQIFDFLTDKLGNEIGACALMGNLYVESRLTPVFLEGSYARKFGMTSEEYTKIFDNITPTEIDTFVHDGAGYGLAQWTYWSRKKGLWEYARSCNKSVGDLNAQLGYLWKELQGYKAVISALKEATDLREASDIVCLKYEKPAHTEEKYLQNRADHGTRFYNLYAIKMEEKGDNESMNSANYVDEQIKILKNKGIPNSEKAWQLALLTIGWAYVFGAYGDYCDPSNRRSRYSDSHPTIKSKCKNFNGKDTVPSGCVGCKWFTGTASSNEAKHEGRTRFFDCRGLIYFVLHKLFGMWDKCPAGATTMWNTASNWSAKGLVKDGVPNDVLVCLFYPEKDDPKKMAHIGFGYKGQTIECSSGVQHFTTYNKKWTHWAVPKCVTEQTVVSEPSNTTTSDPNDLAGCPTLRYGDRGDSVKTMQQLLSKAGSGLTVDGIFGNGTKSALIAFQRKYGLETDGVCGPQTWAKLIEVSAVKEDTTTYTVTLYGVPLKEAEELMAKYSGQAAAE